MPLVARQDALRIAEDYLKAHPRPELRRHREGLPHPRTRRVHAPKTVHLRPSDEEASAVQDRGNPAPLRLLSGADAHRRVQC
jgi:cytochrome c